MATDTLRGTIERITYHNEENGYTVVQLMPEGQAYTVTVVGNMLGINAGEAVALSGAWMAHPQYGCQFQGRHGAHGAAGHHRGAGTIPGQRPDQGDRPGDGPPHRA